MKGLQILKFNKSALSSSIRSISTSQTFNNKKNVAIVLSGCGIYDGSEVLETTSAMIHLSKNDANCSLFAPNIEQFHVINHLTGQVSPETRNVLEESARIARGNIQALEKLKASDYHALVFPGGFGAAKNLSNYATQGTKMTVDKEIERVVDEFIVASKPIGFICISPVLAAKLIPGVELTEGKRDQKNWPYAEAIENIALMGAKPIEKDTPEVHIDYKFKVISTPAFMKHSATPVEVFDGIGNLISNLLRLI
ncbi:ES1 mitochondrial-like [Brachionus plicatilis]|uniref:ES1 mitochondrial-like n=1 Tax=Brachionus plicatilis TaxID=10195 RepID=A0A3M7S3D9_BRAPC|nr:ES1 mitochondrial-like [Brachionus plicatilis]